MDKRFFKEIIHKMRQAQKIELRWQRDEVMEIAEKMVKREITRCQILLK
jgi:hypothetical protein